LRTPLTMILGHTELLREGFFGPIAARQQPSIATIDAQGQRLLNLVNRLLLLQTIASRTLNRASHDLAAWLTQVVSSWKPRATEAGILLLLDLALPLPSIEVDLGLLDEAITNLLENAFKFSPKGGQVTVRASQHEGGVCLQVTDQGIGISPDQMHLVFDRFHQGDGSITRQFGGVGIGLSLCKAIAEAHGGRICAESAGMGQGSAFTIFLPAA
jgi:signal transduction histidine kinase